MAEAVKDSRGHPVVVFDYPCLPQASTDRFQSILDDEFVVFEQGSGGSTVWLAERVERVISIEHSREWLEAIQASLDERGLNNVVLRFEPLNPANWLNPWEDYAKVILEYRNGIFDLVYVDGWDPARLPCAAYAVNKLKPGGYMVIDDSTWPMLQPIFSLFEGWERKDTDGQILGRTDGVIINGRTSFFRKPS